MDTDYFFVLEFTSDGTNWHPVILSGSVIDDTKKIVSGANGTFKLKSTEAAYFELDPSYTYRISETDPGTDYAYVTYSLRRYDLGGRTMLSEDLQPLKWNNVYIDETLSVNNINIDRNHLYRLAYGNYALKTYDLVLSKELEGAEPDGGMYRFQIYFMQEDSDGNLSPVMAIPFTTSPPDMFVVSNDGADALRISGDGNNILSVMAGESVTIEDLWEGIYVIRELTGGYDAYYAIDGGPREFAPNGESGLIQVSGDTRVVFTNVYNEDYPQNTPNNPDNPYTPENPDNPDNFNPAFPSAPYEADLSDVPDVTGPFGPAFPASPDDNTNLDDKDTPGVGISPFTGDSSNTGLVITLLITGAAGLAVTVFLYRRARVKARINKITNAPS